MLPSAVLIVSADPLFSQPFQAELQSQGLSIQTQDKLLQLRETLKVRLPQILVLDLDISPDPPWDVVSALRLDPIPRRLPIVAVSGLHTASRHVILGLRHGHRGVHPKSGDLKVLVGGACRRCSTPSNGGIKSRARKASSRRATAGCSSTSRPTSAGSNHDSGVQGAAPEPPRSSCCWAHLVSKRNRLVAKEELLRLLWPSDHHQKENIATLAQYIRPPAQEAGPPEG